MNCCLPHLFPLITLCWANALAAGDVIPACTVSRGHCRPCTALGISGWPQQGGSSGQYASTGNPSALSSLPTANKHGTFFFSHPHTHTHTNILAGFVPARCLWFSVVHPPVHTSVTITSETCNSVPWSYSSGCIISFLRSLQSRSVHRLSGNVAMIAAQLADYIRRQIPAYSHKQEGWWKDRVKGARMCLQSRKYVAELSSCDDSPEVSSLISGVITVGSRRGHYKTMSINVFFMHIDVLDIWVCRTVENQWTIWRMFQQGVITARTMHGMHGIFSLVHLLCLSWHQRSYSTPTTSHEDISQDSNIATTYIYCSLDTSKKTRTTSCSSSTHRSLNSNTGG